MKVKMFLDNEKPKVDPRELKRVLERAGLKVTSGSPDLGIVVGGDGVFGEFGKTEAVPLLFVGVRSNRVTGSKAYLAAAYYDELPSALERVVEGEFKIAEHKRLEVFRDGKSLGEVFTDVYMQRGADSNCLRYKVKVLDEESGIEEAAIGDGVVISTAAGSTGYYSYPDRIRGDRFDPAANTKISQSVVGICHVSPTYIERSGSMQGVLRYTVPWGSKVQLSLFRPADARLYGVGASRSGIRVKPRDRIVVVPGRNVTKTVSLRDLPN